MTTNGRMVYRFPSDEEQDASPSLLGGKGAGLARMCRLGLPVPPGFTITTEACRAYTEDAELPADVVAEVLGELLCLEERTGKRFGDPEDPLLVSVRSGAPVSMPGMMDTVLNVGLNSESLEGLARSTGDRRFALDSYRRFIQMFGEVISNVDPERFESALRLLKESRGIVEDAELQAKDLEWLIGRYKGILKQETGEALPEDPVAQLELAVGAVFDSWNTDRARTYRREFGIPDEMGTAVTVQAMVFGNKGEDCATGVAFTRNPSTGEQGLFGEFLPDAQGEDVVAGIRTPMPLEKMRTLVPKAFDELLCIMEKLEREYRDMQDLEFTVERGKLYMLQTRSGKRTGAAAVKIANDLAAEGLITREEAVLRVEPDQIEELLHPRLDPESETEVLCHGLGASPGAATGEIVLTADEAASRGAAGEAVILLRRETSPDDVHGMICAKGVLTAFGGMTSHAAVVARGMGKPAVTGCKALKIDLERGEVEIAGRRFRESETITIEGSQGIVVDGPVSLVESTPGEEFETLLAWADDLRSLGIRANADTPEDATNARELGAEGIGLCRTEHMFMQEGRLELVRCMILSESDEDLEEALAALEPLQRGDFEGIFSEIGGLPVCVRLLDPPLHEFLPDSRDLSLRLAESDNGEKNHRLRHELEKVEALEETNPMLGLRGVRLGILRQEIYRMQARAIAGAMKAVAGGGGNPVVEIMVPLVGFPKELELTRALIEDELREVLGEAAGEAKIGTMIEVPRACVAADEISLHADFFSFGTNDLTQTVCGVSRDDAEGTFLRNI